MSISTFIKKPIYILRTSGCTGLVNAIGSKVTRLFGLRAKSFRAFESLFRGMNGLEIGGPSLVFSRGGIFPLYPLVEHLDNCNFGRATVWEGDIKEGQLFRFDSNKPAGQQYISEATAMGFLASGTYDFVLSSHVLEHIANPVLALTEWIRLLKDQGTLVLLLPQRKETFDHLRPVTTMAHMLEDFNTGKAEDDLTHMPEILSLHDLTRDPEAGDMEAFKARSMRNFENRCFHHHVFDTDSATSLMDYMGLQIQAVETIPPIHILIVAQKLITGATPDNVAFLANNRSITPISQN